MNFGHKAGAAAVFLLLDGKTGNTIVDVDGQTIRYMPTPEAIKRREVDISEIALFESLGTCFGRRPQKYEFNFVEVKERVARHL